MKLLRLKFSKTAITSLFLAASLGLVQGVSAEEEISDEQMAMELGEVDMSSSRARKRTKTVQADSQRRVEFDLDNQKSSRKSRQPSSVQKEKEKALRSAAALTESRGVVGN